MKIVPVQQVRHPLRRDQKPEAESAKALPGQEVATQRDVAMLRAATEIGGLGIGGSTPFMVQRLAQLWPMPPLTDPAQASAAYSKPATEATHFSPRLRSLEA